MTKQLSILPAAMLMLAVAGCAAVKPETTVPPVPPSHSVAEADARLATVTRQRAQAEAEFAASERVCYAKFLVNRCLDEAREKHRVALSALRAIEIEAERFKRQANVEARDQAIAKAEKEYRATEAKMAATPPPPRVAPAEAAPKAAPTPHDRSAEQAAKLKKIEAETSAGAAKRAANVAAYEKRKRDAEQRQREIEEKKKKKISEAEGK
jgi:hypothetical protein